MQWCEVRVIFTLLAIASVLAFGLLNFYRNFAVVLVGRKFFLLQISIILVFVISIVFLENWK